MAQALDTGRPLDTIADGPAITTPVSGALEQVAGAIDEILPVSDDTMLAAGAPSGMTVSPPPP